MAKITISNTAQKQSQGLWLPALTPAWVVDSILLCLFVAMWYNQPNESKYYTGYHFCLLFTFCIAFTLKVVVWTKPDHLDWFICLWKQTSQVWNGKNQEQCLTTKPQFHNNARFISMQLRTTNMEPTVIRVIYSSMHAYIAISFCNVYDEWWQFN